MGQHDVATIPIKSTTRDRQVLAAACAERRKKEARTKEGRDETQAMETECMNFFASSKWSPLASSPELGLVTGKPRKPRFGNLALVYSGAAVAAEWLDAVHPVFAAFAVLQR